MEISKKEFSERMVVFSMGFFLAGVMSLCIGQLLTNHKVEMVNHYCKDGPTYHQGCSSCHSLLRVEADRAIERMNKRRLEQEEEEKKVNEAMSASSI